MDLLFEKMLSSNNEIRLRSLKNILFKLQNNLIVQDSSSSSSFLFSSQYHLLLDKIFESLYLYQQEQQQDNGDENNQFHCSNTSFLILCDIIHEIFSRWPNQLSEENLARLTKSFLALSVQQADESQASRAIRKVLSCPIVDLADLLSFFPF
jgi:hypothetical protein